MRPLVVILIAVCCLMAVFQVFCLTETLQEAKAAERCAAKCDNMHGSVAVVTIEDCICSTHMGMIWFKLR